MTRVGLVATAHGRHRHLRAQLAHLRRLGCDEIQGYLFSRPISGPDLMKLLAGYSTYA